MRILQIRFKNLNALVGAWSIDLTQPAFGADGIFAITGPTGAGKSTLLDAICLALYGCTPRLGKITKNSNEIMSRHTGECYAEVTFATQTGTFHSHWSQHRAKKRATGELQNPKHEVVDAATGKPMATALREVAERIAELTGLDFDRFTRSMLLAQGSFAVFLHADPDKRAPILEKITGTAIYSQISIKVHERRTAERNALDALQAQLKGLRALDLAEEQQCHLELQQKTSMAGQLAQELIQCEQSMAWLITLAELEQALAQLQAQQATLAQQLAAFQPEQTRLEQAHKALELLGDYTRLTTLREQQAADGEKYQRGLAVMPQQEQVTQQVQVALEAAAATEQTHKQAYQHLRPVLTQVRAWDARIQDRAAALAQAQQTLAARQRQWDELQAQQAAVQHELHTTVQAATTVCQWLTEQAADQDLVVSLAGIQQQLLMLRNLNQQWVAQQSAQVTAASLQQQTFATYRDKKVLGEIQIQEMAKTHQALTAQADALRQSLQGQTLAAWRETLADLQARAIALDKLTGAVETVAKMQHQQTLLQAEQAHYQRQQLELNHQHALQQATHAALEAKFQQLTERQALLRTIQSLAAHRAQLQDGVACPLCGALEHPYAAGNVPQQAVTAAELKRIQTERQTALQRLTQLHTQCVSIAKDLAHHESQQQACALSLATETAKMQSLWASLGIAEADGKLHLAALRQAHALRLAETVTRVQTAEQHEDALRELQVALQQQQAALHQQERAEQQAAYAHETATANLKRIQQVQAALELQRNAAETALSQTLAPYGLASLAGDALDTLESTLASRRQHWLAQNERHHELEKKLATLHQRQQHLGEQCSQQHVEIAHQQAAVQRLQTQWQEATQARFALLGDKQPDVEENLYLQRITVAEAQHETQRQRDLAATRELDRLRTETQALAIALNERESGLQAQERAFLARRASLGFDTEASYQAACLPEAQRQHLAQQAQQLATAQTALAAQIREKTAQRALEQAKQLTSHTPDALTQATEALKAELTQLQQQMGGIQHRLLANERMKQEQAGQRQQIQLQQQAVLRWDNLHELIGAADGKKYRNFAQGLTFATMITHANQQLQKMSDRYLLTRHIQQPLELYVIDNYQAGEVRSTRNLSGGESFIVSLALALGLSHMASQNVRVDSLFLDEGFGTLDEEALDTALDTLANLQQNGKLIGVISHVQAMKERISTQIQVIPQTGGRSILQGPGCRAL